MKYGDNREKTLKIRSMREQLLYLKNVPRWFNCTTDTALQSCGKQKLNLSDDYKPVKQDGILKNISSCKFSGEEDFNVQLK